MTSRGQRIAQAASLVMAAYLASRALGLLREMVIARQFGTTAELGAYLAAFRIPDLIFQLLAGGALGSSFIPVFAVYLANGQEHDGWRLASAMYNLVGLFTLLAAALSFVFTPYLVRLLVPGFPPEMQLLTGRLMRIMLLTPIVFGLSGISMAVLNAFQHFLLPALAPVVYNLSIIIGALFLTPALHVYGLAVGVVIGACLHLLIQAPGLRRKGWTYMPTLGRNVPGVREVIGLLLPRIFGLAVMQINFVVNVILASSLAGDSLAALNYAFLLMMLPQGIFAMAIATAAFPTFSELVARKQIAALGETLSSTLRAIIFLAIPAGVGLLILRYPLIRVLLERGEFNSESTKAVAWALQFYAFGLPAYAVVEIISRAFYALHDTRTPVLVGVAAVALNVAMSLLLIHPLEHGGLALANALAVNVEMAVLLWFMAHRLNRLGENRYAGESSRGGSRTAPTLGGRSLLGSTCRSLVAAIVMGLGLAGFVRCLKGESPWISAAGGIIVGGGIYLSAAWALRSSEAQVITSWMRQRCSRWTAARRKDAAD